MVGDGLAAAGAGENVAQLREPFGRDDEVDMFADGFNRLISEQALGGRVPAGDDAVERFGDDGVVGGFDHRAEQTLALGMPLPLGGALAAQGVEQPRQSRLQTDILQQ